MAKSVRMLAECPDCGAKPGRPHKDGCDVERCSVCGEQRLGCRCTDHDKQFARWTGLWPGRAEADALGMSLNTLEASGGAKIFFVKPTFTPDEESPAEDAVYDAIDHLIHMAEAWLDVHRASHRGSCICCDPWADALAAARAQHDRDRAELKRLREEREGRE